MEKPAAAHVRAYLEALPADKRRILKQVRSVVRAAVPDAIEHFSYGMPGFRLDGKSLIWYAAFKSHVSLFPMTENLRRKHAAELDGCEMFKGTIRFPLTRPPSPALLKRLLKTRVVELREDAKR